jgi:tetratricopeptide (TPR) repeat protein
MAESCTVAFGRYLRMLRERRGLSLDDVATMSRSLADPVDKSYLSRCENGRYGIGFSKSITLSRIYGVPTEVLAERMELDTELDRIGGPDTSGLSYAEMQKTAGAAIGRGLTWEAYAYGRDSLPLALRSPLSERFRDAMEQHLTGCMNVSTAAAALGRSRYSLHELEHIRAVNHLGAGLESLLLQLLSCRHRVLGDIEKARSFADEAVRKADEEGSDTTRGYAYANRARLASHGKNYREAISLYQVAFKAHRQAGRIGDCSRILSNLANAYLDLGRPGSARRALAAAERLAVSVGDTRARVLILILAGEIDESEDRSVEATRRWREALDLAKNLKDKILQFKTEFYLYRHAVRQGDGSTANALARRLVRLVAWIPADVEELAQFKDMASSKPTHRKRRVFARQP